jgi:hypothetical protein
MLCSISRMAYKILVTLYNDFLNSKESLPQLDAGAFTTDMDKLIIFLPFAVCKVIREVSTEEEVTSFSEPRS